MPLVIKERDPKTYNVVKPRRTTTEVESQKLTSGSTKPETLQSMSKRGRQNAPDPTGQSGWRAPSESQHSHGNRMSEQMNKNYEDHFFKINRGHNMGSVRPGYHLPKSIRANDYFR